MAIITKNSGVTSAVPTAGQLQVGELAVNTADGNLYTKSTDGSVKRVATASVKSISELVSKSAYGVVNVLNYHSGLEGGGGVFYWDATGNATEHNGGTVVSPLATFLTDWNNQTQLATWFDGSSLVGTGVWRRQYDGAVNVKWFGAKGDEVADDTAELQAAIDYVKANGKRLMVPDGTYKTGPLDVGGAAKYFEVIGEGARSTVLIHRDGSGTLVGGTASANGMLLQGFTLDCQFSVYAHPSANHGISISNTNRVRIQEVFVTDYKNSAILIFGTVPETNFDAVLVDCEADGLGNANNGFLIGDMDRGGMTRCTVRNLGLSGSPGLGLQFKNVARWCFMTDCFATNCVAGLALGNDIGALGVQFATIENVRVTNCTTGFAAGYAERNTINNLYVDMNSTGNEALDLGVGCVGNSITNAVVENVANLKYASRTRSGATDNTIHLAHVDNLNSTGNVAYFDTDSTNNLVKLSRMTNPRIRTGGLNTMSVFQTAANNNGFDYEGLPVFELRTIASDAITLSNKCSTSVLLDTEGDASTDDLSTITADEEGRVITIATRLNNEDVVVKNGVGNIRLDGSDCTLSNVADTLTLRYSARAAAWVEISRAVANGV